MKLPKVWVLLAGAFVLTACSSTHQMRGPAESREYDQATMRFMSRQQNAEAILITCKDNAGATGAIARDVLRDLVSARGARVSFVPRSEFHFQNILQIGTADSSPAEIGFYRYKGQGVFDLPMLFEELASYRDGVIYVASDYLEVLKKVSLSPHFRKDLTERKVDSEKATQYLPEAFITYALTHSRDVTYLILQYK
jgi:hypothetical protein